jgi:hypothetical protein
MKKYLPISKKYEGRSMKNKHFLFGSLILILILAACAPTGAPEIDQEIISEPAPIMPAMDTTGEEDNGPVITFLPQQTPPRGAAVEFSTDFSKSVVYFDEILSGGPPKDGIPAIDQPRFVSVDEADSWLKPVEPVILVEVGEDARAYPIQILMWHEIINDTIGDCR